MPPREEESQYASGNQQVIYIAVESEAAAMLVLTYAADRRRKNELQRLEDSGISVIVRTTDPNVTTQLVSRLFGIDTASVGILDSRLGEEYQKLAQKEIPRADALVATKGRMESMMNVISACVEERRTPHRQHGGGHPKRRHGAGLCAGGLPGLLWGHGAAYQPGAVPVPAVLGAGHVGAAQAAALTQLQTNACPGPRGPGYFYGFFSLGPLFSPENRPGHWAILPKIKGSNRKIHSISVFPIVFFGRLIYN